MRETIRPELSKDHKYWIPKHRYYELKYFCLQYPLWKKAYDILDGLRGQAYEIVRASRSNTIDDVTAICAEERLIYSDRMKIIEQASIDSDPYLASYILKAVTEGRSYIYMKEVLDIPCGKDMYYDRYRRFFWILDKKRV